MSPGISESNIRLMLDTFPSVFQFEIYYLTSKTSSDAQNTVYIISLALGELKRKMKWPGKLFTHHIHLLLKPLQESISSSRISHTLYLSFTWQLPEAPQIFSINLGFYTCPSLLPLYAHFSFSVSLFLFGV